MHEHILSCLNIEVRLHLDYSWEFRFKFTPDLSHYKCTSLLSSPDFLSIRFTRQEQLVVVNTGGTVYGVGNFSAELFNTWDLLVKTALFCFFKTGNSC